MIKESNQKFLDVIDRIASSETVDELTKLIREMRLSYGLANIVYHAVYVPEAPSFHPILILTYEPEWVERYRFRDYFQIDPVVTYGTKSFLPLDWADVDHESNNARSFFLEADTYSVGRQGATVPVRGPGGERALFTITSNSSEAEWRRNWLLYVKDFQLIAHYFHEQAIGISGYRTSERNRALSRREKECLQFMARGLAPKQIAGQLGISDSAVRMHLRSSCNKLGCASTDQAVAKLVMFEQIQP